LGAALGRSNLVRLGAALSGTTPAPLLALWGVRARARVSLARRLRLCGARSLAVARAEKAMWRLRGVCAVLLLCFVPSRQVELCAQEYVDTGAKVGFQLVQYALNTGEWEKLAEENSLDPYAPDEKLDVNVPCAYFGSALCTAQASSCKKSKIQLRLKAITGLKSVHIDNLEVSEVRSPLSSRFSTLEAHRSASACWANAVVSTRSETSPC